MTFLWKILINLSLFTSSLNVCLYADTFIQSELEMGSIVVSAFHSSRKHAFPFDITTEFFISFCSLAVSSLRRAHMNTGSVFPFSFDTLSALVSHVRLHEFVSLLFSFLE